MDQEGQGEGDGEERRAHAQQHPRAARACGLASHRNLVLPKLLHVGPVQHAGQAEPERTEVAARPHVPRAAAIEEPAAPVAVLDDPRRVRPPHHVPRPPEGRVGRVVGGEAPVHGWQRPVRVPRRVATLRDHRWLVLGYPGGGPLGARLVHRAVVARQPHGVEGALRVRHDVDVRPPRHPNRRVVGHRGLGAAPARPLSSKEVGQHCPAPVCPPPAAARAPLSPPWQDKPLQSI
mmetsp:Transcript_45732/g.111346  ORF Transcript_45732/g.111346 Transcript_45732/m.111346 type:complete len:234 (+) Transcript_45732:714-1415(+)